MKASTSQWIKYKLIYWKSCRVFRDYESFVWRCMWQISLFLQMLQNKTEDSIDKVGKYKPPGATPVLNETGDKQ